MVNDSRIHIIMPVKDSWSTAEESIRAIVACGYALTVYDDNSSAETVEQMEKLQKESGIDIIHISDYIDHPSPNYRWILIDAQQKAIAESAHLVIVESDVKPTERTFATMCQSVNKGVGMVAAVTHDEEGRINFPYEYARRIKQDGVCKKRFSFCCTLLTLDLLKAYSFEQLDPTKNWYDVTISHISQKLGFANILQVSNPVLHRPHSSRPWKQLKYTNPLLYYWRKITQRRDKI